MRLLIALALVLFAVTATGSFRTAVNDERERAGISTLDIANPKLLRSARNHSVEMAASGSIYHSVLLVGRWAGVGEVVGVGSSWQSVLRAFWNSPEHRRILLGASYDVIAPGIVTRNNRVWVTARLYDR